MSEEVAVEALSLNEDRTPSTPASEAKEIEDDFVDPWNVASKNETGVDYDKLISTYCDYSSHLDCNFLPPLT